MGLESASYLVFRSFGERPIERVVGFKFKGGIANVVAIKCNWDEC